MTKSVLAIFLAAAIMSSLFAKTEIDKNFHQKYNVEEGASLYLKHGDGNVEVTTWSKDVVDIDIVYHATFTGMGRIEPKDFQVEFEKRGDRITVIGREPNVIGISSRRTHKYLYTIKAPAYVSIEARGVDGNVLIEGRENDVKVHSIDGNIVVNDVSAESVDIESIDGNLALTSVNAGIKAQTVDGNINLQDVIKSDCFCKTVDGNISIDAGSGSFEASSVDGNISMLDINADFIDAYTSDGRIELELTNTDVEDVNLKSGDGNVRVSLAAGTSVTLSIKTGDGRIRTDLSPVSNLDTDEDLFRGSINGGGGTLNIRTGDGSVSVVEE